MSGLRETGGEGVKNKQKVGKKRKRAEKGAGRKTGTAALGRQEEEGVWKWQVEDLGQEFLCREEQQGTWEGGILEVLEQG